MRLNNLKNGFILLIVQKNTSINVNITFRILYVFYMFSFPYFLDKGTLHIHGEAGADASKILLYPAKNVLTKNVFLLPAIFMKIISCCI